METTEEKEFLLGIAQEEIAILLNITRGQWSMYKSGLRDLPIEASQRLNDILQHIDQSKIKVSEYKTFAEHEKQLSQKNLEFELFNLKHQEEVLERKIDRIERKQAEHLAALKVAGYLEKNAENELQSLLGQNIMRRTLYDLRKNDTHQLEKYTLHKNMLVKLQKEIKQALKRNGQILDE